MDVQLCQRMLCDNGVFPSEVMNRPLRERIFMNELYQKESQEIEKRRKK